MDLKGWAVLVLLALAAALSGCSGNKIAPGDHSPRTVHLAAGELHASPATPRINLPAGALLPADARAALAQLGAPSPVPAHAGKRASVALPYFLPSDVAYTPGGAGHIAQSSDVTYTPGVGAVLLPAGVTYPGNFSFAIYRVDDLTLHPVSLTFTAPQVGPGAKLGIAVFNWAPGTKGVWQPMYYDTPVGTTTIYLNDPHADFVNPGNDLAFAIFCVNPSQLTVQSFQLDPKGYSETEPNDIDTQANLLPAFNFGGWSGNVGVGGPYDGSVQDFYTFNASPGDSVNFQIDYNPDADYYDPEGDGGPGIVIAIADQTWITTQGMSGFAIGYVGAGGHAQCPHTFDGTETGPFYVLIYNDNSLGDGPETDYFLSGSSSAVVGGSYDEVENNDGAFGSDYNPLTDFDNTHVLNWTASLGSDVTYPGYDGDGIDVFLFGLPGFELSIGDKITLHMAYTAVGSGLGMDLLDNSGSGNPLASSQDGDGGEDISYTVNGTETQPFVIVCGTLGADGFGDYTLTGTR